MVLKGGLAPTQLRKISDYVAENLGANIAVRDLAALLGLNPHHFGQAFKASVGVSPHRYLIVQRLRRAEELLRTSDFSISEIARLAGFSSQSHLTFHFRKISGTTPARYRQLQRVNAGNLDTPAPMRKSSD